MSISTPDTSGASSGGQVVLPPNVQVHPGRETTQTNTQGMVEQGTLYPVTLANRTTTTVFVPNTALGNVPAIQAIFDQKLGSLAAIPVT